MQWLLLLKRRTPEHPVLDNADRSRLRKINAKIAEIESRPAAERLRAVAMLNALQAARQEVIRWAF
jgi:hypothetical protein